MKVNWKGFMRLAVRRVHPPDVEAQEASMPALMLTSMPSGIPKRRNSVKSVASVNTLTDAAIAPSRTAFDLKPSERPVELIEQIAAGRFQAPADLSGLNWHTLSPNDILNEFATSFPHGLSHNEAKKRLDKHGKNVLSPPKNNWFKKILGYFFNGFGPLLALGGILVLLSWKPLGEPPAQVNMALGIVLFVVFVLQAFVMAYQDWSTSRVMASIKNMIPQECQVVRNGQVTFVRVEDVVVGDLLFVKAGNKLPADVRFLNVSTDATFDRSVLTGESAPIAACVVHTDENYLETRNMGLQGTYCLGGTCTGVVVATGDDTVFGHIAALTNKDKPKTTPLEREIYKFVKLIVCIMISMITIVVLVWTFYLRVKYPAFINVPTLIVSLVSVGIAFIPEGLPISITLGLQLMAWNMRKAKVLVKSLKTVETLGSVSVICSDKTGTLTQAKMAVIACSVGVRQSMTVAEAKKKFVQHIKDAAVVDQTTNAVKQLSAMCALCNAAEFALSDATCSPLDRKAFGDATDTAILRFSEELQANNVSFFRICWNKFYELGFNSKNKFMIRCFKISRPQAIGETLPLEVAQKFQPNDLLLTIKGAPDVLIGRCSQYVTNSGTLAPLDDTATAAFEQVKDQHSSLGRRCIFLAHKTLANCALEENPLTARFQEMVEKEAQSDLVLVGLVVIHDPLRPDIPQVVSDLRRAGIRIPMVTGDFALTAVAIAREAGLVRYREVDQVSVLGGITPSSAFAEEKGRDWFKWFRSARKSKVEPTVKKAIVVSGPELDGLNDNQWKALIGYEEIVFARTTPEQKLKIVREFQADNIVAMTGDGVNDAPSLKAADVGISMSGASDIATGAADIILLDNFSSIVLAVKSGRIVFDNLKKVIAYLLPAGSFSEFWPVMTCVLFGLPQILSSFLMIIICCLTDAFSAVMLAVEKPEADLLRRPPRNTKKDRLVDWRLMLFSYGFIGCIETTCSFAMSYWYLQRNGVPFSELWLSYGGTPAGLTNEEYSKKLNEASSVYFVTLMMMQFFNLLCTRTRRLSIFQHPPLFNKETQNPWLVPAVLASFGMGSIWVFVPALQKNFGTGSVPVEYWFLPCVFGMFIMIVDEARRYLVRKWPQGYLGKMAW